MSLASESDGCSSIPAKFATQIRVAGPGTGWTDVKTVAQHPQFKAGERGTPDLALLKMIKPAPALPPTLLAARPAAVGDRLIIVGYGLAAEDDRWTFGTARMKASIL